MLPQERYNKLIEYLQEHEIIKIDQIVSLFDISIETARRDLNHLEKEGIIKKIYGGATLMALEVGTTTLQVAKALKEKRNLTVITNSIHVVNELMDTDFDIYVIGGKVRHGEGSVSGALTMFELENFQISKAIIGGGGLTLERGLSDYNIEEALVRKKVVEKAKEVILVVDHSKFGRDVLAHICPITAIDIVITDRNLNAELAAEFESANVNLVLA